MAHFSLGGNFLQSCLITFSLFILKLPNEGTNELSKGHFSRSEGLNKVNFGCFTTSCQFSQKLSNNFFLFLVYNFLGMILINCQEMDFIELFKRSFSMPERSGLAHFTIIIYIIQ